MPACAACGLIGHHTRERTAKTQARCAASATRPEELRRGSICEALLMLAERDGEMVLVAQIADRQRVPKESLELILLELKKHGLLYSQRGRHGGDTLGRPSTEITFGQVVRIIDGPLAPPALRQPDRLSALRRLPGRGHLRHSGGHAPGARCDGGDPGRHRRRGRPRAQPDRRGLAIWTSFRTRPPVPGRCVPRGRGFAPCYRRAARAPGAARG